MKRKMIAIFLIGIMCLSLSACEKTPIEEVPTTTSTQKVVAYSPAARGFDSLEEFKGALASMQSSAKSQNQAFGLDEIWVPANLPENAVLEGLGINQYAYVLNYRINEDEDIKKSYIGLVVYFGRYNDDGSKAIFNNESLKTMAEYYNNTKYAGAENIYYDVEKSEGIEVGKTFFYAFQGTQIQLTIPNTVFDEIIELGLDPFLLKVI